MNTRLTSWQKCILFAFSFLAALFVMAIIDIPAHVDADALSTSTDSRAQIDLRTNTRSDIQTSIQSTTTVVSQAATSSILSPDFTSSTTPSVPTFPFNFNQLFASTSASSTISASSTGISTIGEGIAKNIKCVQLQQFGPPIPTFSSECAATSTPVTPPSPPPPTPGQNVGNLKIIKLVTGGGFATSSDFIIHVKSVIVGSSTVDVAGSPQLGNASGTVYSLPFGTYLISEDATSTPFDQKFSGDCTSSGMLVLSTTSATCTIENAFAGGVGGGGGEVTPPGGGGGGTSGSGGGGSGGGGGGSPSTSAGGGGGGGGSNGPPVGGLGGGGSPSSGAVLGASTSTPQFGVGGYTPEVPNTGAGGDSAATYSTLILSLLIAVVGLITLHRKTTP